MHTFKRTTVVHAHTGTGSEVRTLYTIVHVHHSFEKPVPLLSTFSAHTHNTGTWGVTKFNNLAIIIHLKEEERS
jgi:hypothetical protein